MKKQLAVLGSGLALALSMAVVPMTASAYYSNGISYTIDADSNYCYTLFETVDGNLEQHTFSQGDIKIVKNKQWVIAHCKFLDESAVSADSAESISPAPCTITDAEGNTYLGEGRGVAANNNVEGFEWGNSMIQCKAAVPAP